MTYGRGDAAGGAMNLAQLSLALARARAMLPPSPPPPSPPLHRELLCCSLSYLIIPGESVSDASLDLYMTAEAEASFIGTGDDDDSMSDRRGGEKKKWEER